MKILTLITTLLLSNFLFSQNLSLDEVIKLRKGNFVEFEEYLNSRGWEFYDSEKDDVLSSATFTYNKSNYDDKAESFISFQFTDDYSITIINMQIAKKAKYNEYLSKVKSYKCKLIDSEIKENGIVKVYQGATTTFKFEVSTTSDNIFSTTKSDLYYLNIYKNADYNKYFK